MKKTNFIFFTAALLQLSFIYQVSFAQNNYDYHQAKKETLDFLINPAKWEKSDWLKLSGVVAGTVALMHFDSDIRNNVLKDQKYYKSFPIETGRIWGEAYTTGVIGGMFYLHGIFDDNVKTKKLGYEILQSAGYSGSIALILKVILGRYRPYASNESQKYNPFSFDSGEESLPSGHATLAFSLSTVLANNTNSTPLKIIFYVPAFLTVISRVYQNKHWASDTFLGAALGYFVGYYVTNLHSNISVSLGNEQQINFTFTF
ncbi:phosphatase PAP2 family protein [Melioribacteraceae bacterium 4301-Me]|uniref:phosphatase PAP2 family protein n=1 Tax=Pyranulibacter aquaticus TaxID=3163344 RepID=UPI00359B9416